MRRGGGGCAGGACGSRRSSCGSQGCGSNGCGTGGCSAGGSQGHFADEVSGVDEVPAPISNPSGFSRVPSGGRPVVNSNQNNLPSAPIADIVADPSTASLQSIATKPQTKESAIKDLESKGWVQETCTEQYCTLKKGTQEKRVFNDGRVEDVAGAGFDSIDTITDNAAAAEKAAQAQTATKHGFRYVKGQGQGIQASELASVMAAEQSDAGTSKVLITFGTTWCGPCKSANNVLSAVSSKNYPGVTAVKVLVDEQKSPNSTTVPGLAKFPHSSYPTAYVVSKDAAGNFDFSSIKRVNVINQSAASIMSSLK